MFLMPRHPSDSLSPVAGGSHASKSGELVYRPFISVLLPRTRGPSLHRLRICFSAIATSLSKQPWIEACSSPLAREYLCFISYSHYTALVSPPVPRHLAHIYMMTEEYHTSEFQNLNHKLQRRLYDVLPIQQSHDTISFLALGGLHEDKLCVTLQEAMTPANVERFMKPPYSISREPRSTQIVFADTQPAFPAPKRSKHAPIRLSRPHINTEVYDGGLKLMQLACEPASTFPKPCPSTQKGPNLPVRAL